jgi:hypothetical protein
MGTRDRTIDSDRRTVALALEEFIAYVSLSPND